MANSIKRDRPPKTTEEMVAGISRQIRGLLARAEDEDPWVGEDAARLQQELEDVIIASVAAARRRNPPTRWADIGTQFGISKQGAFNRFAARVAALEATRRAQRWTPERIEAENLAPEDRAMAARQGQAS
jgi:hypothetical protein